MIDSWQGEVIPSSLNFALYQTYRNFKNGTHSFKMTSFNSNEQPLPQCSPLMASQIVASLHVRKASFAQ